MCGQVVGQRSMLENKGFEGVVGCKLAGCHKHGTHAVRPDTAEERPPALVTSHANETGDGIGVVVTGVRGESCIALHPDVQDIGWVAGYATEEAGCGGQSNERGKGWGMTGGGEAVLHVLVDAEAGGGVR